MKNLLLLLCLLLPASSQAASSERIGKRCDMEAKWAAEIYDIIVENPDVILNSMNAGDDAGKFAFIRKWIADKRPRTELMQFVWSLCPDSI